MTRIFPDARDYKTINMRISATQRKQIEQQLGFELLPGQQNQFQYFDMTDSDAKKIGTIIAASQKGEYGAIEFIFGLDTNLIIKGLYIQRSREKDNSFKEKAFLELFIGKTIPQACAYAESSYKGKKSAGIKAIINGLKKEYTVFNELVLKKEKNFP